jgi:hypothetical protein
MNLEELVSIIKNWVGFVFLTLLLWLNFCCFYEKSYYCDYVLTVTSLVILIFLIRKSNFKKISIYLYSFLFIHEKNGIFYVPIIKDKNLYYIPFKYRLTEFHIIDKSNELDNRAMTFLARFICTINKPVKIFHLTEQKEKVIIM